MGNSNIKGITVEINGTTEPLQKALKGVNSTSINLQSELKEVNRLLKLDPTNTELLNQKQKLLSESITNTKGKIDTLKEAERQAQEEFEKGNISEEQYRALQREVIKTEQDLKKLESQAAQSNAVLSKTDAIDNLKNIGKAVATTAVAVGAATVAIGTKVVTSAGELQKWADQTGFTTERIQELQYVGKQIDLDFQTLISSQTKLTRGMAQAKDGTGAQAEAFKKLGISIVDSDGNLRDSKVVMLETIDALGMVGNETERDALSLGLFGRSALELNPLIKAGSANIAEYSKQARENGAVMSDEAVAGLDNFGDTLESVGQIILGSVGTALSKIMPDIQMFLEKLMKMPQWIKENSTLLTIIGVIIGTITALVIAFNIQQALAAAGLTVWSFAAGIGATVTTALGAAFAFLTSPIGLIILAIGALIAIGVLLYKNWDTVSAFLKNIWNSIATFFTTIWTGISTFFTNIWNNIVAGVMTIIRPFIDGVMNIFNNMHGGLTQIFEGVKSFFVGIWEFIKNIFLGAILLIYDLVTGNFSKLKEDAQGIWNNLKEAFSNIWEGIKGIFSGALEAVKGFLIGAWENIKTNAENAWNNIVTGIRNIVSNVKEAISAGFQGAIDWIKALPAQALQWGKDLIQGLIDGIKGGVQKIGDAAKEIADKIRNFLHFSTPDEGPLADYESWMPDFMGGLARGIEKSKGLVTNAIRGLSADMSIGLTPSMAGIGSFRDVQKAINQNNDNSLILKIENFNNYRSQDIKAAMEEMEFYRKQAERGVGKS